MRTVTCEQCGLVFEPAWSDEEANAEAAALGLTPEFLESDGGRVVVCDDCYPKMTAAQPIGQRQEELIAQAFDLTDSDMAAVRADVEARRAARAEEDKQRDTIKAYIESRVAEMMDAAYERARCLNCGCTPMWSHPGALLWCPMCGAERPDETGIGLMATGGTIDLGIRLADDSADFFRQNKIHIIAEERLRLDSQRPRDMFGRVDPGVVADPGVHLSWPSIRRAYRAVAVWVGTLRTGR